MARSNWDRVAGAVALASLFDALDQVSQNMNVLGQKMGDVRARGYRFGRDWENRIGVTAAALACTAADCDAVA